MTRQHDPQRLARRIDAQLLKQDFPRVLERLGRFIAKLIHGVEAMDSWLALVSG